MYKKDLTTSAWFLFFMSWLGVFLLSVRPAISNVSDGRDLMEGREEQLRIWERRDQFFKQDPQFPLKESDRKKFQGLFYYPVDFKCAMVGSVERYPFEPKPLYAHLPTSKGLEKKYVKYGRFKFRWMGKEYTLQIYRPLGGNRFFHLKIEPLKKKRIRKGATSSSNRCREAGY